MFSPRDVDRVLELVHQASVAGRTTLMAIDGLGGAGKSTLASQVAEALEGTTVVRVDDFYRPLSDEERTVLGPEETYYRQFDWERLRQDVLMALGRRTRARYRRHDWETNRLAEWHEVPPGGVVIVEGVYATRPELRRYYGVTVFVDTQGEHRLSRMLGRGYADLSWVEHWMAAEDWYVEQVRPAEHADLVVKGA